MDTQRPVDLKVDEIGGVLLLCSRLFAPCKPALVTGELKCNAPLVRKLVRHWKERVACFLRAVQCPQCVRQVERAGEGQGTSRQITTR